MSWPQIALGDLCDIKIGKTPARAEPAYWSGGTLPWLSIADMNQGRNLQFTKECVTEAGVRAANMKLVEPGTLLLSYKLSIGKVGIAQIPMYTNEAIAALSDLSSKLEPSFMYWALQHVDLLRGADRAAMGATLNKAKLSEIKFPVPPLDEQRRIAAILDKADALRAKRREAIAKLDQLLQSVFFDMFGDPVTNPKGWSVECFGDIAENKDGRRRPLKSSDRKTRQGPYPYYGASGIIDSIDDFLFDERNLLIAEDGANLLSRSTPIAFIATGKYWVNNHAHVVGGNGRADLLFLLWQLNLRDLSRYITGSAQPKLNQSNLNSIPIPLPPVTLQQKFARRAEKIGGQKRLVQQSLERERALFASLQHRAFTGTL